MSWRNFPAKLRVFCKATVSSSGMDRVTDSREKGRTGIFGTAQSYADD